LYYFHFRGICKYDLKLIVCVFCMNTQE
jgi:hypothetical protein